jgi:hypothetical protein
LGGEAINEIAEAITFPGLNEGKVGLEGLF